MLISHYTPIKHKPDNLLAEIRQNAFIENCLVEPLTSPLSALAHAIQQNSTYRSNYDFYRFPEYIKLIHINLMYSGD